VPTLQPVKRDVTRGDRWTVLGDVLDADEKTPTILFANTRQQCDTIGSWLEEQGDLFADYRGQMEHKERRDDLARFRSRGKCQGSCHPRESPQLTHRFVVPDWRSWFLSGAADRDWVDQILLARCAF
jgi:hypothetical protein